jgi:hypothetical protein
MTIQLLEQAKILTQYGFCVIPVKEKRPILESWTIRRKQQATEQELFTWFSNGKADNAAITIDNTEFGIDTDGPKYESIFLNELVSALSSGLQEKVRKTMYTKTPNNGYHRTFRINSEDFPDGIRKREYVSSNGEHGQILLIGKDNYLVERGIGYEPIRGVECIATLTKLEVEELLTVLETFKKQRDAIIKVAKILRPYYSQPNRNDIIFALSGYLHKCKTPIHITTKIADQLIDITKYPDEDRTKIHDTIKSTFDKPADTEQVSGYDMLHKILTEASPPDSQLDDVENSIVEIESTLKAVEIFEIPKPRHKSNQTRKPKQQGKRDKEKDDVKTYSVYKYSKDIPLAEEIVLGCQSVFLQIIDGEPTIKPVLDFIKEKNIILRPHEITNQLTPIVIPYAFRDIEEIKYFIKVAREKSIYDLFLMSESLWKQLLVAKNEDVITFYTTDTIYSYFQDLFPTTHYDMIIGVPGAGKGAVLVSFKLQGYRPVTASGMSGASLLELLGSVEACQVTILEDELQNMDNDPYKETAYKIGYDETSQVPKTLDGSTSSRHNQWYLPYCFKILAAEQPPDSKTLGGFNDRTFRIWSLKGKPKYLPKTILHQLKRREDKRNPKYRKIISKMLYLRKLLLVYRLLHHEDIIEEVETNIDGRALELTSPQIYLFSSDKLYSKGKEQDTKNKQLVLHEKILPALSRFLRDRGELTKKTLEGVVYDAIVTLLQTMDKTEGTFDINGNPKTTYLIPYEEIIAKVKELTDGEDDSYHAQTFVSSDYDKITHNQILDICKNRFSGYKTKSGGKRVVEFNKEEVEKEGKVFDVVTDIEIIESRPEEEDNKEEEESELWADWQQE